jgi:transposase
MRALPAHSRLVVFAWRLDPCASRFRAHLAARSMAAVIPPNASRSRAIPYDRHLYKERHLIECFINKIKHFRRIATRYDKTIASYASFVAVASFMVLMR